MTLKDVLLALADDGEGSCLPCVSPCGATMDGGRRKNGKNAFLHRKLLGNIRGNPFPSNRSVY